jgi:hypothetical protein
MSRKTDLQSATMLGVFAGCFAHLVDNRYYAKVEIQELCKRGFATASAVIKEWPLDSDDKMVVHHAIDIIRAWNEDLNDANKQLPGIEVVFIASCVLADLQSVVNSPYKKSLLSTLNEFVHTMEEFVDPTLGNIPAYDRANELLKILYAAIGWDPPKKRRKK